MENFNIIPCLDDVIQLPNAKIQLPNGCNITPYDKIQILHKWNFNVISLPNVVILLLNIEISHWMVEFGYYLDKITIFLKSSLFYHNVLV